MRVTGRVEILVNGKIMLNKTGATASGIGISGQPCVKREPIVGDTGIHGYKETIEPSKLDVKVTDRDDISLNDLAAIYENGTIIMRAAQWGLPGGKVYTMHNATCEGAITMTTGEGETTVVFYGPFWTETT